MKELTTEQKAQRYDEAKARMNIAYNSNRCTIGFMNEIFPELAESEDERIRKALRERIIRYDPNNEILIKEEGISQKQFLAWLEKQGQTDSIIEKAKTEKQRVIITETDGNANIDWDTRSLEDARMLLGCGLQYINTELEKKGEQSKEAAYTHEVETGNGNIKALVTEKVQLPKFKVGDKVYSLRDRFECTIESVDETVYYGDTTNFDIKDQDDWELVEQKPADKVSLDFKKGDILYEQKTMSILLVYERNGSWLMTFCDYWMLKEKFHIEFPYENYGFVREMSLVHATKEQRDLLFQKMKKAGYEWDAEKKELKKIEDEEYNGEDYGIDSLYHAQRILEKTLGKVDGYQSDDGVLEHKCAISAVKKLYEQNHAWSEEDEKKFYDILAILRGGENCYYNSPTLIVWLKSLKDRCTWKPSEEQMDALDYYANSLCTYCDRQDDLRSLLHDLKKL